MKKIILLFVVVAVVVAGYFLFRPKPVQVLQNNQKQEIKQESIMLESINGLTVSPEVAHTRPVAFVVENDPEARPQSGLTDADMVYEAPTEGGITRFLAVYQTKQVGSIGPIRSARVYFVELANELGAVFAHVGGNSDALANIRAGLYKNISDADQFFNDPYFTRVAFRKMPHNVYTSVARIQKLAEDRNYSTKANFEPWNFKDDSPVGEVKEVTVDFSLKGFLVKWVYNSEQNNYLRYMAGVTHKDFQTKEQIVAKNIIVQMVETADSKTDTLYSINIDLSAGGKAYIFLDGKAIAGTWKKQNERTRYFDSNGTEINFNRGPIWVELVPEDKEVSWK